MTTHFHAAADGVSVAVHALGGQGPALVMAHAAGFHGMVFAPLAAELAADFRCVAPDGRGHGDTLLGGRPLDWPGLAADVLAAVDGLGLERPYAFGHSSGGTAVLLAEQARPGTFRAMYCYEPIIIPVDPPLGTDTGNWLAAQARRRRDTFPSADEALRHYSSKPPLDALSPPALRAYVEHGFEDDGAGGVRLKCRPEDEATVYETATGHDSYARLPEVTCPVTVACGGLTPGCDGTRPFASEDRLPAGRSEVVPGVGHFGPLERPDVVATAVRRALLGSAGP
ncbi:MAG: alpha/beta fold hydrolase [Acidimicrobiales bacterium]